MRCEQAKGEAMDINATISAVATALGDGAVGIIRLSGRESLRIIEHIFVAASGKEVASYPPHTLIYGHIIEDGMIIDEVLVAFMQGPHSYTAEDVVEIQAHGGVQALQKILALTYAIGARPAEPGEFTKRAFLNGRIDLVQAEAVMDIIKARSEAALKLALRQQSGQLSQRLRNIRGKLRDIVVNLEAVIDYPEEDIEEITFQEVETGLIAMRSAIQELLAHAHTGKILREGLKTAIIGRPNVGKSSLLNQLLKEERAIVSEVPGTTRDIIEEQLLIDGVPLVLADTAGIRVTEDYVEQMGVAKSRKILQAAELVIVVLDGSQALTPEDREILTAAREKSYVIIVNKSDLTVGIDLKALSQEFGQEQVLKLSAKTSEGLEQFTLWLKQFVYGNSSGKTEECAYVQNTRHEYLLRQAEASLEDALKATAGHIPYDCIVIDLRNAIDALGTITGETVRDEIINEIFAKFCIGK
ncbi:MAG: tRNA uridine-5-carboxymethylaminomethyl(34) synthesis GTPase MnmE [Acidaminococcaceae bacterium]